MSMLQKKTTFLAEIVNVQGRCLKRNIFQRQRAFSTWAIKMTTNRFGTTTHCNILQQGIGTFHVCVRPDAHITRKATKTHTPNPTLRATLRATIWATLWAMLWATLWTCYERFRSENGCRAPFNHTHNIWPKICLKRAQISVCPMQAVAHPREIFAMICEISCAPSMWTVVTGAELTKACATSKMPNRNNFNIVMLATSHLHSNRSRSEFNIHSANEIWWQEFALSALESSSDIILQSSTDSEKCLPVDPK